MALRPRFSTRLEGDLQNRPKTVVRRPNVASRILVVVEISEDESKDQPSIDTSVMFSYEGYDFTTQDVDFDQGVGLTTALYPFLPNSLFRARVRF